MSCNTNNIYNNTLCWKMFHNDINLAYNIVTFNKFDNNIWYVSLCYQSLMIMTSSLGFL